jgi:hypothetical protein
MAKVARRKILYAGMGNQDEFILRVTAALDTFVKELRSMLGHARSFRALKNAKR